MTVCSPIVVTPVTLTCDNSRTPARNSTLGPTVQNGPTSTSSASLAPSATRDEGSIRGISGLCDHRAELGLGDDVAVDLGFAAEPPHVLAPLEALHVIFEPVAWDHGLAELGFIDGQE